MTKKSVTRGLMLASATMIFMPETALAQTAAETTAQAADEPAAAPATAAPDDEGSDEEIIVTARRTEENVQRVPSSLSAFNERTLDRLQASDTTGLQGAVPNLNRSEEHTSELQSPC